MTHERPESPQADLASHDPSEARPESCVCGGGTRRPDPTDRYMGLLDELADLGMALTRDLVADAREAIAARRVARAAASAAAPLEPAAVPAADPAEPEPELTPEERAARDPSVLAFHRMTRAVRLCIALSLKLHNDRVEREQGMAQQRAAGKTRKPRLKGELERLVKEAIEHEAEPSEGEGLERALSERLDEEDIERDLDRCSKGELVGRVCRDLGIEPNWDLWRDEPWAREEARLKPHGSPYAEPPEFKPIEIVRVFVDPKPRPEDPDPFPKRPSG